MAQGEPSHAGVGLTGGLADESVEPVQGLLVLLHDVQVAHSGSLPAQCIFWI